MAPNTTTALTTATTTAVVTTDLTATEVRAIVETMSKDTAPNTLRAYGAHVCAFAEYCTARGWVFVPGDTFAIGATSHESTDGHNVGPRARVDWVLAHLNDLSNNGASLATLDGRVRALNQWHQRNGYGETTDPTLYRPGHSAVSQWFRGYRNSLASENADGARTVREAPGLLRQHVRSMVAKCDTTTLVGLRDRALLLIGWAGAFRRSELVAMVVENITYDDNGRGLLYHTYNTKSNKTGAVVKQLDAQPNDPELCPVLALNAWLERANITSGVVFRRVGKGGTVGRVLGALPERDDAGKPYQRRANDDGRLSDRMVDKVVRTYATRANLNGNFCAHSLRAGYATQASIDGIPDAHIRAQGWSDNSAVVLRYQRRAGYFTVRRFGGA
jgi:integrase